MKFHYQFIRKFKDNNYDYLSNTIDPTFPDGLDVEVFTKKILKEAYLNCEDPKMREHVTPWMKLHKKYRKYSYIYFFLIKHHELVFGSRRLEAKVLDYIHFYNIAIQNYTLHPTKGKGKNFHQTGGFGPYMLSADEVSNYKEMKIQTRLNGEIMQDASLTDLIFPIEKLINYCSTFIELSPGDVIVTGTPGGVGDRRDPPVYMKDGDVIEIEISHLGVLKNIVHKEN